MLPFSILLLWLLSTVCSGHLMIDCFIFYNEVEMLFFRFSELNHVIDYFVIVESRETFAGNKKELVYLQHKDTLFLQFKHKVIYVVIDSFPIHSNLSSTVSWQREYHQRNCIHDGIDYLAKSNILHDDDIILISDLDEIPNATKLEEVHTIRQTNTWHGIFSLHMHHYKYHFNCRLADDLNKVVLVDYRTYNNIITLDKVGVQYIRDHASEHYTVIMEGGWHLSYFGPTERIIDKISNFAHQEYNLAHFKDPRHIERLVGQGYDVFEREYTNGVKHLCYYNLSMTDNAGLPVHKHLCII